MIIRLRMQQFKSFFDAELELGPLTTLLGANASGKSNVRDALRFLHGVGRGYTLADIFGGKWGEGGERQWHGIRGGIREAAYSGEARFALEIVASCGDIPWVTATYRIEVAIASNGRSPRIFSEKLLCGESLVYDTHPDDTAVGTDEAHIWAKVWTGKQGKPGAKQFVSDRPILTQLADQPRTLESFNRHKVRGLLSELESIRFLDLSPDAMRVPSAPGQTILGDHGENLSSVLQEICTDARRSLALAEWLRELTPMDAKDFEFPSDQRGFVLLRLREANGQETSAYSASDGTLRFLAMLAAILGQDSARIYCLEELDNGIHPARLHLLLQLIENHVGQASGIQVIASTHSPYLLLLLSDAMREYASLAYRLEGTPDTRIRRIMRLPDVRRVLETQDISTLHASGWLEHAAEFADENEAATGAAA